VTQSIHSLSCVLSHAGELCTALPGVRGRPRFSSLHTLVIDVDHVHFKAQYGTRFLQAWDTLLDLLYDHEAAGCTVQMLKLVGMNSRSLVDWVMLGRVESRSIDVARSLVCELEDKRAGIVTS
jgi:hypothetical protein